MGEGRDVGGRGGGPVSRKECTLKESGPAEEVTLTRGSEGSGVPETWRWFGRGVEAG